MSLPYFWQKNQSLKPYNTLGIQVDTAYFAQVDSLPALQASMAYARQQQLPVLILGGGSNVVLVDNFPGVTLLLGIKGISLLSETDQSVVVKVMAGENWHDFVTHCLNHGWHGLENLALIPGTVGAAPIQNIGAYGVEQCEFMQSLDAMVRATGDIRTFSVEECDFGYRDSIFKGKVKDQFVICSVTFELLKQPKPNLSYGVLQQALADYAEPTPKQLYDAVVAIRQAKIPNPKTLANVGSFFKNPRVSSAKYDALIQEFSGLVAFADGDGYKLAAGWLIDQSGWKGVCEGSVGVHSEQALVLVNLKDASGHEVLALAQRIQEDIQRRYGIELEIEPRIYRA